MAGLPTHFTTQQAWNYHGKVMDQQETKHFVKGLSGVFPVPGRFD